MPQQTATMAAPARAVQARVDWIDACRDPDDFTPALTGWRVGLAVKDMIKPLVKDMLRLIGSSNRAGDVL